MNAVRDAQRDATGSDVVLTRRGFLISTLGAAGCLAALRLGLHLPPAAALSTSSTCEFAPWRARYGLSFDELEVHSRTFHEEGFGLIRTRTYRADGALRTAALWEPRASSQQIWVNISEEEFKKLKADLRSVSVRPVAIDGFIAARQPRYTVVWEPESGSEWRARVNLSGAEVNALSEQWRNDGLRPVRVSAFVSNGTPRYAVIWEESSTTDWVLHRGLTPAQFSSQLSALSGGYNLEDVTLFTVAERARVTAVWVAGADHEQMHTGPEDRLSFVHSATDLCYRGYRPVAISAHRVDATGQYVSVWNNHGVRAANEDDAATAIEGFMQSSGAPGLSLAIAFDGRLVYARGFGTTERDGSVPVTVDSVFRIGSVSKAITAVAVMKLIELGMENRTPKKLTLDSRVFGVDPVFGANGVLGTTYGDPVSRNPYAGEITVRHLLQHSAGGWGNDETSLVWRPDGPVERPDCEHVVTTQAELLRFVLNNECSIGKYDLIDAPGSTYRYSGFGYLLLARIIEAVTGVPYLQFVRDNVLPVGSSMTIGEKASRLPNEVTYYHRVGEDCPYELDVKRADAGGGWVATATDLVRFMCRVDGVDSPDPALSEVLHQDELRQDMIMPSGVDGNEYFGSMRYGMGWISLPTSDDTAPSLYWHGGSISGASAVVMRKEMGSHVVCMAAMLNTLNDCSDPAFKIESWTELLAEGAIEWECLDLSATEGVLPHLVTAGSSTVACSDPPAATPSCDTAVTSV